MHFPTLTAISKYSKEIATTSQGGLQLSKTMEIRNAGERHPPHMTLLA